MIPLSDKAQIVHPDGRATRTLIAFFQGLFGGVIVYDTYTATQLAGMTASAGARAFCSDSSVTTFGSTVAGSGSTLVPVYGDGTNWKVG